jgi:hypothetical protein
MQQVENISISTGLPLLNGVDITCNSKNLGWPLRGGTLTIYYLAHKSCTVQRLVPTQRSPFLVPFIFHIYIFAYLLVCVWLFSRKKNTPAVAAEWP